jgi:hypothetical protein
VCIVCDGVRELSSVLITPGGLADWDTEVSYVDVWKRSRDWVSQEFTSYVWSTGIPITLNANGYPAQLLPNQKILSMMLRDLDAHGISGTYIVLYDGDGILTPSMQDIVAFRRFVGRLEVDVRLSTAFNNGFALSIERTNPDDPIRNVRVITPGFESSHTYTPFHPAFLQSLGKYKVVRFMPWMDSNALQSPDWSTRSKRSWRSYGQPRADGSVTGSPIEDMVLLANMVCMCAYLCGCVHICELA